LLSFFEADTSKTDYLVE